MIALCLGSLAECFPGETQRKESSQKGKTKNVSPGKHFGEIQV